MLVRRLSLRNIRSYNDGEEVNLAIPEGVILFEGDIGSGKSTLLYALEFGLFGFSDMKGAHLLSEGKSQGSVSVTFESGEREHTIERHLKVRGADVVQDECYISSGGERTRLSPSDLKERVVALLGFNEPTHPKAESLVYRYAVFTPQEQMKDILVQNAEHRLHVIRRVLGAQSYQVAAENSELVEKRIKVSAYGLKKASEDLEYKEGELRGKSGIVARLEEEIPQLAEREASSSDLVRGLEGEWKESLGQREALRRSEGKIPLLKQEILDLQSEMREAEEKLREQEEVLSKEIDPVTAHFESRKRPSSASTVLEGSLDAKKDELARLKASKQAIEDDLTKHHDLITKGICPLCGQKIPRDLRSKTAHTERELDATAESITELAMLVSRLSSELDAARAFERDEKDYHQAIKEKGRIEREINSLRKKLQHSNGRLSLRRTELAGVTAEADKLQEVSARVSSLESRLKEARQEEKQASLAVRQARTELADAAGELHRLSTEVKKKREDVEKARRLSSFAGWLSTFFRPTVELIEKQTLSQAAARFNEHFQRFFTSLVEDPDMVVRVKEDFTPLFERQGFEQDFEALSGGERTSMALAYRFALNSTVNEALSSRPELVILDEPTDGFSKEQIYKMRGLLEELDSRQVILVSHETELESMADHIFRVEKRDGTSTVSVVAVQAHHSRA